MTDAIKYDNRSNEAVTDYYYFKFFNKITETEDLYRFYVERDDIEYCCHPWKDDDGFLTTINVWWNRYALGHNEGDGDADDMLRELVEKYISRDVIKEKALAGDFSHKYTVFNSEEEKCLDTVEDILKLAKRVLPKGTGAMAQFMIDTYDWVEWKLSLLNEISEEVVPKYMAEWREYVLEKAEENGYFDNDEDIAYKVKYKWCGKELEYFIRKDEDVAEDIIESLVTNEMMVLLQTYATENIAIMPVFIYEHSMISISTGSYGDPWDSGCAGFAYIEKSKYEKMCGKDTWDIKLARQNIEMEVHTYDQYLQGDVYCYQDEKYDVDTDSFESDESCGSFYSDNWGDKLAMELVNDVCHEPEIISEEEAEAFIENALKEKAERDAENAIMAQCEYGIAI